MKARAIATALAAAVLFGVLVVPGGAVAIVRHYRQPAQVGAFLSLRGTRGFAVNVVVFSARSAVLLVTKQLPGGGGSETVTYANTHGQGSMGGLEGRGLNLRFGKLGHFRARFFPKSTNTEGPQRGCTGGSTIEESGGFVGSFNFHGERGYTTVDANRSQGEVIRSGGQRCVESSRPRHPGREKAHHADEVKEREGEFRLLAADEDGTQVQADRRNGPGASKSEMTTVSATTDESVGALEVSRSVEVPTAGPGATSILQTPNLAEPLSEATLQPPAPFSGAATFALENARSASWTGDLTVSLPGAAPLPLTGDGIAAGACIGASDCTKTLPGFLQLDLEASGGSGFFGAVVTTRVGVK